MDQDELLSKIDGFISSVSSYEALSNLAVVLAKQAGEEVKRPLSEAQLVRALRVHMEESEAIRLTLARYLEAGKIGWPPQEALPESDSSE